MHLAADAVGPNEFGPLARGAGSPVGLRQVFGPEVVS
jgi:hypothetical protein